MSSPEYGHFKAHRYNPFRYLPGEGIALRAAYLATGIVDVASTVLTAGRRPINVGKTVDRLAIEEMDMHVVTGKDPAINPILTGIAFLFEQAVFDTELIVSNAVGLVTGLVTGEVSELGVFALSALAKAGLDLALGKVYEAEHYRKAREAHLPMKAISNTITLGAVIPIPGVTSIGALMFGQWLGRARARERIRNAAKGKI